MHSIREINPHSESEIQLVAERMRQTLVEVVGQEKGTGLYTMEWLVNRVRWHLDSAKRTAKIFIVENQKKEIVAHAIARIETEEGGQAYGYFSTLFVEPGSRKKGLAKQLLAHVEMWFRELKLKKSVYNTDAGHSVLLRIFENQGYRITHKEAEMVQLTKELQ